MADKRYTIQAANNRLVQVRLRRDKRLRKTSRWEPLPDGSLLVRIPERMPSRAIRPMLEAISGQLENSAKARKARTDTDLQRRAELINHKHFGGSIQWNSIRWVNNMRRRLGSCSRGGTTDGEIRISAKIKSWPDWVVDYVIAHELLHSKYPNHSAVYWAELKAAYPLAEKARGFVEGAFFISGQAYDDEAEE